MTHYAMLRESIREVVPKNEYAARRPMTMGGRSGQELALAQLKNFCPELFKHRERMEAIGKSEESQDLVSKVPAGFVAMQDAEGWYWNPEEGTLWAIETKKFFMFDQATGEKYELNDPMEYDMDVAVAGTSSASAVGRRLIIPDLHKVSLALKLKITHLDSPAALLAVLNGNAEMTMKAAKNLHFRLLAKFTIYLGLWTEDRVRGALAEVLAAESQEADNKIALAVSLIIGRQLFVAASRDVRCIICRTVNGVQETTAVTGVNDGVGVMTGFFELEPGNPIQLGLLTCSSASLSDEKVARTLACHTARRRPYAACADLVAAANESNKDGTQVVVGMIHLQTDSQAASSSSGLSLPATKRQRTDAEGNPLSRQSVSNGGPNQVRVRHILLRHVGSKVQPIDPVRRKNVTRTIQDAEKMFLRMFPEFAEAEPGECLDVKALTSKFTGYCRELSECTTSLKSTELAGDLGWLTRGMVSTVVPASVVRAAFQLQLHQVLLWEIAFGR
eukprot:gnl/MRDRNA2_/MRDRNA2_62508_c0_seq1.p1 gnl/MRDRNA2_/MRDRNA2_62508_c0~~gnl/MRDRNA2_/MRDRNA2_62508_c0_seq1.p1  ORF type:complete len:524 (-),score=82.63 gnl/MRDRNA2_/MRDRNA2_62508_c0_seq1:108-1616(-)